jgi:hypothetical protein
MNTCPYCRAETHEQSIFCGSCGCALEDHYGPTAILTWLDEADHQEMKYLIGEADRFVGRDSSNDIVLIDDQASVKHVKISFDSGTFRVADLGSSNGTFVNGEPFQGSRDLEDEDLLRIGTTIVRFEYHDDDH